MSPDFAAAGAPPVLFGAGGADEGWGQRRRTAGFPLIAVVAFVRQDPL